MSADSVSETATLPNTPEAGPIEDETLPSGDFARITPISTRARIAFHNLADGIDENLGSYRWHRRYLYIRNALEDLSDDGGESTGAEGGIASPESRTVRTGFWRLNLEIRPMYKHIGWVLGKGRWGNTFCGLHGGVDLLLTNNGHEQCLYGRHARIVHNLQSNSLVIFANRKMRVDGESIGPGEIRAFRKIKTSFAFGPFEYQLEFTDLDGDIYRGQLAQLAKEIEYEGQRPASFTDPTPTDTDYALKNYTIRSSFAKGSSCYVCEAIDKSGAPVAVKKIIANNEKQKLRVEDEIEVLRRITEDGAPSTICRFIEYIAIEPSKSSGITECYLISQPLIHTTLASLLLRPTLSIRSRLSLVAQALSGLAFIHSKGCMHRDIKPENILGSAPPLPLRAVIIDFGAATFSPISTNHLKGTIRYLAPEIIVLKRGTARGGTYDKRADMWSMGLTAYEVLCAWRFKEDHVTLYHHRMILNKTHWQHPFPQDQDVTKGFEVINEMLAWEANKRVTAQEALQHEVFSSLHFSDELTGPSHTSNKRPGAGLEGGRRPRGVYNN